MMTSQLASLRRFVDLGTKAGVDVMLTPTLAHGNIAQKMYAWRLMNPDQGVRGQFVDETVQLLGEPHPFVNGEAVERYHNVLLECYGSAAGMEDGFVVFVPGARKVGLTNKCSI